MALNPELLAVLACPKCKGPVKENEASTELICTACSLAYEIQNEIPVMVAEAARPVSAS